MAFLGRIVVALSLALLLQACGTYHYEPEEYVIADGRIPKFPLAGNVRVINGQPDDTQRQLFAAGSLAQFMGDHKTLTEQVRIQVEKEIGKNGTVRPGADKTIELKVVRLHIVHLPYRFLSDMDVVVTLGDGQSFTKRGSQGSPSAMQRVINGTVAIAVIEILKDEKVLAYLAK